MNDRFMGYKSTDETTTATAVTGSGYLKRIIVNYIYHASPTAITIYDNTAASGTVLFTGTFSGGTVILNTKHDQIDLDVAFQNGLHVVWSNANSVARVTFIYS